MTRLALTVFSLIAPTLAGVCVVIALVSGVASGRGLFASAGAGVLLAGPVSWGIAWALDRPH
jgi:hypothetical protein